VPTDSSPTEVTITWNTNDVSQSEYDSVLLDGTDMLTQNSHTFSASPMSLYTFQIICSTAPNEPPLIFSENPADGSSNIPVSISSLEVTIQDSQDDIFDWTIESSPNIGSSGDTGASEGVKTCAVSGLSYSTTYLWYVNATDPTGSGEWRREIYTFITENPNQPPYIPETPSPENHATGVGLNPTLSVYVEDPDNDVMNVNFYDSSDQLLGTDNSVSSGSRASFKWIGLEYETDYYWYTVADDGEYKTRGPAIESWHFTTETIQPNRPPDAPRDPSPTNNLDEVSLNPTLSVYVEDPDNNQMEVRFYNASDDSLIGFDESVSSGTRAEIVWSNLNYDTIYSWYVIADDGELTTQSDTWTFTTKIFQEEPPKISINKPASKSLYFLDTFIINLPDIVIIIGEISIEVQATDDQGIAKVEYYIDNEQKHVVENEESCIWIWREITFGKHLIKVIAYDIKDKTATDEISVWKFF
jgi:hypothetical protein